MNPKILTLIVVGSFSLSCTLAFADQVSDMKAEIERRIANPDKTYSPAGLVGRIVKSMDKAVEPQAKVKSVFWEKEATPEHYSELVSYALAKMRERRDQPDAEYADTEYEIALYQLFRPDQVQYPGKKEMINSKNSEFEYTYEIKPKREALAKAGVDFIIKNGDVGNPRIQEELLHLARAAGSKNQFEIGKNFVRSENRELQKTGINTLLQLSSEQEKKQAIYFFLEQSPSDFKNALNLTEKLAAPIDKLEFGLTILEHNFNLLPEVATVIQTLPAELPYFDKALALLNRDAEKYKDLALMLLRKTNENNPRRSEILSVIQLLESEGKDLKPVHQNIAQVYCNQGDSEHDPSTMQFSLKKIFKGSVEKNIEELLLSSNSFPELLVKAGEQHFQLEAKKKLLEAEINELRNAQK